MPTVTEGGMIKFNKQRVDSWDIFDLSPRKWWVQAMFCGLTLSFFLWAMIIGITFLLIYLFD